MRILIDECLPRRLGHEITGHSVATVQQAGWAGISNGKLLQLIAGRYDVFITVDKNLPAQQQTSTLPFAILLLRAESNKLSDLLPLIPQVITLLPLLQPGSVTTVASSQT